MRLWRLAAAIVLLATAGFLAFLGSVVISNLWDDYKDSPDAVYIAIGSACLTLSALFAAGGLLSLSRGPHRRAWLAVALMAAMAAALPYAEAGGSPAYLLNGVLAALAIGAAATYLRGSRPA